LNKIRVFVNYPKYSRSQSTDIKYMRNFFALSQDSAIEVVDNKSLLSAWIFDLASRLKRSPRITCIFTKYFPWLKDAHNFLSLRIVIFPWQVINTDVIISYRFFPYIIGNNNRIPIILCGAFNSNQYAGVKSDQERLGQLQVVSQFNRLSKYVVFSAKEQVQHFNSLCSEFRHKIVYIPKLLPQTSQYITISASEVSAKFNEYGKINIIFVGREGKRKGLFEFLEALNLLSKSKLSQLVKEKVSIDLVTQDSFDSLSDIKITHYQSLSQKETLELMQKSHIFCLPTKRDSYGLVYIEAMASGCAIIADNQSPRTELLQYGKCGMLVDPNNVNEIAIAIEKLLTQPEFAKQLALAAYQRFNKMYSYERTKNKYLKLIKKATE